MTEGTARGCFHILSSILEHARDACAAPMGIAPADEYTHCALGDWGRSLGIRFLIFSPFARPHDAVFSPFVCDFHIIILTTYPHPFCFPRFPLDCCSETRNGRGKGTSDAE